MISPFKIKWRSYSSLDFDLFTELCFAEGDSGETETFLSKEAVISESYDGSLRRAYGYKYNESFTFTLTFIKKNYDNFTRDENRKILAWLTGGKNASFIDVYTEDSERPEFCCLGNFINVSQYKMGNSRIVGYTAEFESLTPYSFSPLWSVTSIIPNSSDKTLTMYRWKATYSGVNVGPQYLYTTTDTIYEDTVLFQCHRNEDVLSYSDLYPWETIEKIQDDKTYRTTGGYIVAIHGEGTYDLVEDASGGDIAVIESEGIYNISHDAASGGDIVTIEVINTYDVANFPGADFILNVCTDESEMAIYPKITIQTNPNNNIVEVASRPTTVYPGVVYYYKMSNTYYWWDDKRNLVRSSNKNSSGITDTKIVLSNTYTDIDGVAHTVTSEIGHNIKGETIILDGANKVVSSDRIGGRIFGDDFDFNWMPLMNGNNTFSVIGNCTVTVEWREPIKAGQYC